MGRVEDILELQRRRFMRIPVGFKVQMDYVNKSGLAKQHFDFKAIAENLSEGGILLSVPKISDKATKVLLNKHVALDLEFSLPFRSQSIETQGRIVWHRSGSKDKPRFGIQFVGISKESQDKIVMSIINQIVEWSLEADQQKANLKKQ